jgi:phospholipase/lecithinase/hemolysin
MRFRYFLRLACAVVLSAFGTLSAHAYDKIIVFGDSYNDVGNIYLTAAHYGIVYPPPPYYDGRFSNGPIWIEHVASDWKLPLLPSVAGGTDYATGGAELLKPIIDQGLPIPSIEDQVGAYLLANGGHADPHALYVIEGGGNDILGATDFVPGQLACEIAKALYGIEKTLRLAGARSFLVPELINVGDLPAAKAAGPLFDAFASASSLTADEELLNLLAPDEKLPGIEIYTIATFHTFDAIVNSKTHFGFINISTPCLTGPLGLTECADPDHTLFWDGEHLTEFGHTALAVLVEGQVVNH